MLFLSNTKTTARYGLVKGNNIVLHFTGNTKVSAAYRQTREQLIPQAARLLNSSSALQH